MNFCDSQTFSIIAFLFLSFRRQQQQQQHHQQQLEHCFNIKNWYRFVVAFSVIKSRTLNIIINYFTNFQQLLLNS